MKRLHLLILIAGLFLPHNIHAQFEGASESARSVALGGMFVPMADDPSALFINCAGLVNSASWTLYGDFSEASSGGYGSETVAGGVVPLHWFTLAAGWYRREADGADIKDENLFIAGLAKKLISNMGGSYLSVGGAVKAGRIAYEPLCDCPGGGSSETNVTGDVGVVFRPLPVVSFGYSMLSVRETDFEELGVAREWSRENRWGISYFWEERVAVGFEQRRSRGVATYHYGLSVMTSTPIEILAGFDDGDIQGGLRWVDERVRVSVAFGSGDAETGVYARASIAVGSRRGMEE